MEVMGYILLPIFPPSRSISGGVGGGRRAFWGFLLMLEDVQLQEGILTPWDAVVEARERKHLHPKPNPITKYCKETC